MPLSNYSPAPCESRTESRVFSVCLHCTPRKCSPNPGQFCSEKPWLNRLSQIQSSLITSSGSFSCVFAVLLASSLMTRGPRSKTSFIISASPGIIHGLYTVAEKAVEKTQMNEEHHKYGQISRMFSSGLCPTTYGI